MKTMGFSVAMGAVGLLLAGAHGAMADHARADCDRDGHVIRTEWRGDRDHGWVAPRERVVVVREVPRERVVVVRDEQCARVEPRAERPFAYIRAANTERDCRHR